MYPCIVVWSLRWGVGGKAPIGLWSGFRVDFSRVENGMLSQRDPCRPFFFNVNICEDSVTPPTPNFLLGCAARVNFAGDPHNPCLDAFMIALKQTQDGNNWYTSTKELQLASLQFCAACRGMTTLLALKVKHDIPRRLLAAADASPPGSRRLRSSRVTRLRVRRVWWNWRVAAELTRSMYVAADATEIIFGCDFDDSLENVAWPCRLRTLRFALESEFDRPIEKVSWSTSLQQLRFGSYFNQPIGGVLWLASLKELTFGYCFDQSIETTQWPPNLLRIVFGNDFNKPIAAVSWPDSLTQLWFGANFQQPLWGVSWPASLRELTFENGSNHPMNEVVWPTSLEKLALGGSFNQPIEGVTWPDSIRQLSLGRVVADPLQYEHTEGDSFDQSIDGVAWPASLQLLAFGDMFNQPLQAVRWLDKIRRISFGRMFQQSIDGVTWPASLRDLCFGAFEGYAFSEMILLSEFNRSIDRATWPASLRRITLGGEFRHSLSGLGASIPNLKELCLLPLERVAYGSLLGGIRWPNGLQTLEVYEGSVVIEVGIPQSVQVVYRTRGR